MEGKILLDSDSLATREAQLSVEKKIDELALDLKEHRAEIETKLVQREVVVDRKFGELHTILADHMSSEEGHLSNMKDAVEAIKANTRETVEAFNNMKGAVQFFFWVGRGLAGLTAIGVFLVGVYVWVTKFFPPKT